MKNLELCRSIFNRADLLGLFDEYLEENKIYEQCPDYDKLIEKVLELKQQGMKATQIVEAVLVYLDEQYDFHPDKDMDDEETAEIWKEDLKESIDEVMEG